MSTSVSFETAAPEPVARVVDLMSTYQHDWALCGGWAVDAWLGRLTREHGDTDVIVFDQGVLFEHLPGWQLLAHDPLAPEHNGEWWDGDRVLSHRSHIHARPPDRRSTLPEGGIATTEGGFGLEFQLNERARGDWVMRGEPHVSLPLSRAVRDSAWGLPTVTPEVLLFYKAADLRRRDKLDFLALLPQLTADQRDWLREAIALVGHPWLTQLAT